MTPIWQWNDKAHNIIIAKKSTKLNVLIHINLNIY